MCSVFTGRAELISGRTKCLRTYNAYCNQFRAGSKPRISNSFFKLYVMGVKFHYGKKKAVILIGASHVPFENWSCLALAK